MARRPVTTDAAEGAPAALRRAIDAIRPLDAGAMAAARERQAQLTKPAGSLGRLEELAVQLAGIARQPVPAIDRKVVVTCAGDHGVTAAGVSAYPAAVTAQMVYNFVRGGAAINVLARRAGARVVVADLGVAHDFPADLPIVHAKIGPGTANMAAGPAMPRAGALRAIAAGIALVERELAPPATAPDGAAITPAPTPGATAGSSPRPICLVGTGDMGIGNTTASSAIVAAVTGAEVASVTGRGTGVDDATWRRKVAVIERALALNRPDATDPLDVLAKVGGYEIGGLLGVMLGAAAGGHAVVIDGFISGAAALLAAELCPGVRDYLIPAHASVEIGHRLVLERLELAPLLALDLRLGEGTGAALAMPLVEAALAVAAEMATFDQAGVSRRHEDDPAGQAHRQPPATARRRGAGAS